MMFISDAHYLTRLPGEVKRILAFCTKADDRSQSVAFIFEQAFPRSVALGLEAQEKTGRGEGRIQEDIATKSWVNLG